MSDETRTAPVVIGKAHIDPQTIRAILAAGLELTISVPAAVVGEEQEAPSPTLPHPTPPPPPSEPATAPDKGTPTLPQAPPDPLEPYAGPWTLEEAAHLARRVLMGPTLPEIRSIHHLGRERAIQSLTTPQTPPTGPLYQHEHPKAPEVTVPVGEEWAARGTGHTRGFLHQAQSLSGWQWLLWLRGKRGVADQMELFWKDHFALNQMDDHRVGYGFMRTYQEHALGNYRNLLKTMVVHPATLIRLDGHLNGRENPNENLARELMEMYTLGVGHYNAADVATGGRVLTGWKLHNFKFNPDGSVPVDSYFEPKDHDVAPKQFSEHFKGHTIARPPESQHLEVFDFVDLLLSRRETAVHLTKKLYRWFVDADLTPAVMEGVILPLAGDLFDGGYEIRPVLMRLLNSAHFFAQANRGQMIKNPVEFSLSILRPLGGYLHLSEGLTLEDQYEAANLLGNFTRDAGMYYYGPKEIEGWEAYNRAPQFYRLWINPVTLQLRSKEVERLFSKHHNANEVTLHHDFLGLLTGLTDALNIDTFITETAFVFLPGGVGQGTVLYWELKEVALSGLPDFEWDEEMRGFVEGDGNMSSADNRADTQRLKDYFRALFSTTQFQRK